MGIQFGSPSVSRYVTSTAFHIGVVVGLIAAIATGLALDKLGSFMFGRGYAKPFFVFGRRVHHVWISVLLPFCYVVFIYFMTTGNIHPIWDLFWYRLALILPVVGVCLAVDFIGDSRKASSTGIIRHEWVYVLIPAYIFAFVVNVFV
jgi:ABC-type dipeptide/oligopeptide/nickel transport system permease component